MIAALTLLGLLLAGIALEAAGKTRGLKRSLRRLKNRRVGLPAPSVQAIAGESWREHTPAPTRYADV